MLLLKSDRLRVEIAEPHEAPNTTTRFDRAGFITEIVLDGTHRFCASEPNNLNHPSSGGRGLCSEYLFDVSAEASVGEVFPKPGIGLLTKTEDAPYRFWVKYDVEPYAVCVNQVGSRTLVKRDVEPNSVRTKQVGSRVRFVTEPTDCMGYALWQEKEIAVDGAVLSMDITLKNVGDKPVLAREYCHNFLTANSMALGADYKVFMPQIRDMGNGLLDGMIKGDGRGYTFAGYSPSAAMVHVQPEDLPEGKPEAFAWAIENKAAGVRIDGRDEINFDGMGMWCADHMISVEAFHRLSLKPGESCSWRRSWEFASL